MFFLLGSISFLSLKSNNLKNEIVLEIPKNTSLKDIAHILQDHNVIDNKYIFISYAFLTKKFNLLKAGEYYFNSTDACIRFKSFVLYILNYYTLHLL